MKTLLFAHIAFAASALAATNSTGPRIQFPESVPDFGVLQPGAVVAHDFIFTNTGDALLKISAVFSSCGCTEVAHWSPETAPGRVGSVSITYNTAHQAGLADKTVILVCNDPSQPTNVIHFKANVIAPIEVIPEAIVLDLAAGSTSSVAGAVEIINHQELPLTLSPPQSDNPFFAADLKTILAGRKFLLTVRTVPEFSSPILSGKVRFATSDSNLPSMYVPIIANVHSPVSVVPSEIDGDTIHPQQSR